MQSYFILKNVALNASIAYIHNALIMVLKLQKMRKKQNIKKDIL